MQLRRWLPALGLLLTVLLLCTPAVATELQGEISWVYDGDTLKIDPHGKVRLLGIDVPETTAGDRDNFYLRRGISEPRLRQTAAAAKNWLIREFKGEQVSIELDRNLRDQYGRLLGYVRLKDGRLLNELLLQRGYATVFRRYDCSRKSEFMKIEDQARRQQRGLWQDN